MKNSYFLFFLLFSSSLSAQILWENFEDTRKGTYGFINGTFIPYTANPDPMGNTSAVAASYTRNAAELFDVLILDGQMADLSDYLSGAKSMSIDVWSPVAGKTVQITLENSTLAQPANFPTGRHSVYLATTTVANGWETLTFSFDNQPDATVANDDVDRIVLLFDPNSNNGDTYFWDNFNGPELANDPCAGVTADPNIINDFECQQNINFTFSHSGVNFRRILNPDQNGNTSDYVASYIRNGGEEFDVIIGKMAAPLALTEKSTISLDVWDSAAPTLVRISLQNANNDVILAVDVNTSGSNAWETLTADIGAVAAATDITQIVILFDPEGFSSDQYYFDNLSIGEATSIDDLEEVISFEASPNPSQGVTNFEYELTSKALVDLSIYDITGSLVDQVIQETQAAGKHQNTWIADQQANGIYFYTLSVDGKVATGKIMLNK